MRKNYTKSFIALLLIVLACSLILPNLFSAENEYWIDEGYHNALTTYQYQSFNEDASTAKGKPVFDTITITEDQKIKYWLHTPKIEEGDKESKPLIVYIGGSSQMQYAPYSLNKFTLLSTDKIAQLKETNKDNYLKSEYYGTYLYENESFENFSNSSFLTNIEKYQEDCYKLFVKLPDTMFWKSGDNNLLTIRTVSEYFRDDKLVKRIGAINESSGEKAIVKTEDQCIEIINYTNEYQICLYIKENIEDTEWQEIDNQFYRISENNIILEADFLQQLGYNNCSLKIECAVDNVSFKDNQKIKNFIINNQQSVVSTENIYYAGYNSTYDASRLSSNVYSQVLMSLINKLEKEYNIDYQRECIAGFSVGATFAFDTIAHYPNKFASAILIAPTSVDITPETTGKLRNMNIWCFISEDDHSCNKYLVKELVDAINKNSGNNKIGTAQYTIFKATGHSDQIFDIDNYISSKYEAYQKNTELLQNSKELKSNEDVCDFIFESKREDISKEDFQNSKIELVVEQQETDNENYKDYLLICKGTVMDCQQMGFVVTNNGLGEARKEDGKSFAKYENSKSFVGSTQASVVTIGDRVINASDYGCDYISIFTLKDVPTEAPLTIKAYAISDMGIIFSDEIKLQEVQNEQ